MSKVEWKQKHLKAFKMYLRGQPMAEISKELEIGERTVYNWERRGKWKEHLDKQTTELIKRANTEILDEKERSLKLIKAAESYWAKQLQDGTLKASFNDLASLQKAKWEILAPKTMSQFNFMKQETTINEPSYVLKIIKPDEVEEKDVITQGTN